MTIHETTDRVQEIGREFLKPFPLGWRYTLWTTDDGHLCTACGPRAHKHGWP